jgi:DNA-binding GntR family transcriptional regulator
VREALRRLEAQGLVEIGAHKGARVTSQTDAHVEETYLIRIALESLAARLALQDISDDAFKRLVRQVEALTNTLEKQIHSRNLPATLNANFDIHMALYRLSGRPRLLSMIENLWATYPFGAPNWPDHRWEAMLLDHLRFLEVLKQRDAAKMAAEMERHIRHARDLRTPPAPRTEPAPIETPVT